MVSKSIRAAIAQDGRTVAEIARSVNMSERGLQAFMREQLGLRLKAVDRLTEQLGLRLVRAEEE